MGTQSIWKAFSFTTDILLDEDMIQALRSIINLGQVQKSVQDNTHNTLPASTKNTEEGAFPSEINPRDQVLKTWK